MGGSYALSLHMPPLDLLCPWALWLLSLKNYKGIVGLSRTNVQKFIPLVLFTSLQNKAIHSYRVSCCHLISAQSCLSTVYSTAKHHPRYFLLQELSDTQVKFSFANKNSLLPREYFFFLRNWATKWWDTGKTFFSSFFFRSPAYLCLLSPTSPSSWSSSFGCQW